jgi:hypothetical protein
MLHLLGVQWEQNFQVLLHDRDFLIFIFLFYAFEIFFVCLS